MSNNASMQFYLHLNGATRGPLSEARVQALLADGTLLGSDLAAEDAAGPWIALSAFPRFSVTVAEPAFAVLEQPKAPAPAAEPFIRPAAAAPFTSAAAPPPMNALELTPLSRETLGPYSRATLAPNERAFYRTSLHWMVFVRFAGIALLAFLFLALPFAIGVQILLGSQLGWLALPLPAFILLRPTLAFASSELVITDRRVLIKTGIVHRETLEMFIPRIESVGIEQGFFGRMFDFGTVTIRGTGGSEEPFEAIAHPIEFRNFVQRLQSAPAS